VTKRPTPHRPPWAERVAHTDAGPVVCQPMLVASVDMYFTYGKFVPSYFHSNP